MIPTKMQSKNTAPPVSGLFIRVRIARAAIIFNAAEAGLGCDRDNCQMTVFGDLAPSRAQHRQWLVLSDEANKSHKLASKSAMIARSQMALSGREGGFKLWNGQAGAKV